MSRNSRAAGAGDVVRAASTVPRSNFFLASLWAPLPPVIMLAGGCLWVYLFPGTIGLGETASNAAGAILIGTPVVYTAVFGASYFAARALHGLRWLSRWTLLCLYSVLPLALGIFFAASGLGAALGTAVAVGIVVLGLVAVWSAALVWWLVGAKATPLPEPLYEKRPRSRRSSRRDRGAGPDGAEERRPVNQPESALHELLVRWDPNSRRLLIMHPDRARFPAPLAEVGEGTLHGMSSQEASKFIGDALTRLIPDLRSRHTRPAEPGGDSKV